MSFENFLRTIPLVHRHIMRTRLLIHQNKVLRKFLDKNGINADDILANNPISESLVINEKIDAPVDNEIYSSLKMISTSLRSEQLRSSELESKLCIKQIDINNLIIKESNFLSDNKEKNDK